MMASLPIAPFSSRRSARLCCCCLVALLFGSFVATAGRCAAANVAAFSIISRTPSKRTRSLFYYKADDSSSASRGCLLDTSLGMVSSSDAGYQNQETSTQVASSEKESDGTASVKHMAIAGALATMAADMCMHPVDCIKTLQQSDRGIHLSLLQAAQYLYEEFGVAGFYRGFLTYACSDACGGALKFAAYEVLKKFVASKLESPQLLFLVPFVCAALAFTVSSVVLVPGELLKSQLQMSQYDNVMEAISAIYATSGWKGFFTGYEGIFLRDVPYTMLELGLYDLFKTFRQRQRKEGSSSTSAREQVVAASLTGGIGGYITTPLDTIKTKIMVDGYSGGFIDCLTSTVDTYGLESVFNGGEARVAWLVPATAIYLPCYDYLKQRFQENNTQETV